MIGWWWTASWALPLMLDGTPSFQAEGPDMGAAVGPAVFDLEGDGDWDVLYVTNDNDRTDVLHLMLQAADGSFEDVGAIRGLLEQDLNQEVRALLPADLDHDGLVDIVMVEVGETTIFWNDGASFTAHVLTTSGDREGAALVDLDRDGWLDLVVQDSGRVDGWRNTSATTPRSFEVSELFATSSGGSSFLTAADANHDGWVDLFLHADHDDLAWHGVGPSSFQHLPSLRTADGLDQDTTAGKGTMTLCDIDRTGDRLAVLPTEAGVPDPEANGFFRWSGAAWAPGTSLTSSTIVRGALCAHLDHLGAPDVLFGTDDAGVLVDHGADSPRALNDDVVLGMLAADIDDDGDLDVVVQSRETSPQGLRLYRNDEATAPAAHLQVQVRTRTTRCDALPERTRADLGAQVVLLDSDGQPVSELQELMGGHGRGQVMWPVLHFVGVDPTTAYTVRVFPMADRRGTEPSASPQGRPYVDIEGVVPADLITGAGAQRLDLTLPLCDRVEPLPTGDTGSPSSTGDTGVLPGTGFTADTGTRQGTSDTGRRPSLTGDTGSGPATSTAVDTSGPSAQGPVAAAGCGCASGSVPTAWGALLGLLIGLRRRRVGPRSR